MKSLRNATRAWSTVAYQAITSSKFAVLRTTWANFCGAIRCDAFGRVRLAVATWVIASSMTRDDAMIVSRKPFGQRGRWSIFSSSNV
jgi:hypothetical protein